MKVSVHWLNENALSFRFNAPASTELSHMIAVFHQQLMAKYTQYIDVAIPGYCDIYIVLKWQCIEQSVASHSSLDSLIADMVAVLESPQVDLHSAPEVLSIPVWYDPFVGPDLQAVADFAESSVAEVIARHSATTYTVCALGFAPGFAYMGFVDDAIAMPRRSTPRPRVAKGSVAIAGRQTGVYPNDSPGGWQVIGRTPLNCFDLSRPIVDASLFSVGQQIRFESINREQYRAMGGELL